MLTTRNWYGNDFSHTFVWTWTLVPPLTPISWQGHIISYLHWYFNILFLDNENNVYSNQRQKRSSSNRNTLYSHFYLLSTYPNILSHSVTAPKLFTKRDVPRKLLKFLDKTGRSLLDICHILKRKLSNCLPRIFHHY